MSEQRMISLLGRLLIQLDVHVETGLHIGGAGGKVEIGGVDSPVIRDPISGQPYLPGSSVRGKMRSLTERLLGKAQNFPVNRTPGKEVWVHTCQGGDAPQREPELGIWRSKYHTEFRNCQVCSIFGVTGDEPVPHPTALVVRDAMLSQVSVDKLKKAATDLPFTEVKWEATIDRVTSAATPRQIERVPAGAVFTGLEMIYNIYGQSNLTHLPVLFQALSLVEEDYLGGLGARGSGKVRFELVRVTARQGKEYRATPYSLGEQRSVAGNSASILAWLNGLKIVPESNERG